MTYLQTSYTRKLKLTYACMIINQNNGKTANIIFFNFGRPSTSTPLPASTVIFVRFFRPLGGTGCGGWLGRPDILMNAPYQSRSQSPSFYLTPVLTPHPTSFHQGLKRIFALNLQSKSVRSREKHSR